MPPGAIIRTDADAGRGGGHAVRCLALALALNARGWTGQIACSAATPACCPEIARTGWRLAILAETELDDPDALFRTLGPCDLLVVDHYGLGAAYERACRPSARRILAIDDLADRRHDCDLLLDQTPGRRAAAYRGLVPASCRVFAGARHALLRPEFAALRGEAVRHRDRTAQGPVRRILVSLGLGDASNATATTLEALALLGRPDLAVDVVLGPSAPHRAAVEAALAALPQARLLIDPPNMAQLILAADLAIGAPGGSSLERACLGLPSLLLTVADNQTAAAERLHARGAARLVGRHPGVRAADLAAAISDLVADSAGRARMAKAAARLCDGRGAGRLADNLTRSVRQEAKFVATNR